MELYSYFEVVNAWRCIDIITIRNAIKSILKLYTRYLKLTKWWIVNKSLIPFRQLIIFFYYQKLNRKKMEIFSENKSIK